MFHEFFPCFISHLGLHEKSFLFLSSHAFLIELCLFLKKLFILNVCLLQPALKYSELNRLLQIGIILGKHFSCVCFSFTPHPSAGKHSSDNTLKFQKGARTVSALSIKLCKSVCIGSFFLLRFGDHIVSQIRFRLLFWQKLVNGLSTTAHAIL